MRAVSEWFEQGVAVGTWLSMLWMIRTRLPRGEFIKHML